jgi:pyruvate-ferredoxin/flavodoxin oxidoreductase
MAEGVFGSRISLEGNPDSNHTLVDWALGQERFASQFEPLAGDGKEEAGKQFTVSKDLAETAEQCLANWQTLQELAGIVTPFTERLEQEIRAELADEHQAALDAQKQASAAEIREIKEKTQEEIASKIRSRLLQLAAQKRD